MRRPITLPVQPRGDNISMAVPKALKVLWTLRNQLIVCLTPILLLPVILCIEGDASSCAYVIMVMAVFWVTEALPINVTGLLPVFMFPMVGVMSAGDVAGAFFKSTSLMFTGGMMVAIAIERWEIHRRMALGILLMIGSQPVWLMLGLMLTAWFLSMWISNTATTAMMLPICTAIVDELKNVNNNSDGDDTVCIQLNCIDEKDRHSNGATSDGHVIQQSDLSAIEEDKFDVDTDSNHNNMNTDTDDDVTWRRLQKAFCLCIAYAANIGGTGSLTGTVPNLVLQGQLGDVYEKLGKESPITFASWLLFGMPTSLVIVLCSWLWLQFYFLRCSGLASCCRNNNNDTSSKMKAILKQQYKSLGKLSFAQVAVIVHFVCLTVLWITRDLGGSIGWAGLFKDKFVKDSVPAILIGTSLFVFPSTLPRFRGTTSSDSTPMRMKKVTPLMPWNDFTLKMPWGIIFLLGGGFSMAKAAQVSGLSAWIGSQLSSLTALPPWALCLCLCFIVAAATEVTSNTATTSLILPVLADLSIKIGLDPVYLMLPVTIAASFAFMLPVATPPNAVIFSSGHIKVIDMVKAGFLLNIVGVVILVASMETLGRVIYL